MNQPFQDYDMGALVSWTALIQLRDGVNAALEAARNEKKIGKSLEPTSLWCGPRTRRTT